MEDDLVLIYTAFNPMEAKAVVGNLESHGIQVFNRHEAAGDVLGITVGALGEVELFVREADYEAASAILDVPSTDSDDEETVVD